MGTVSKEKQQLTIDISVVGLVKGIMEYYSISADEAFKKVLPTTLMGILNDYDSGLCFESAEFLVEACILELENGEEEMKNFITTE